MELMGGSSLQRGIADWTLCSSVLFVVHAVVRVRAVYLKLLFVIVPFGIRQASDLVAVLSWYLFHPCDPKQSHSL